MKEITSRVKEVTFKRKEIILGVKIAVIYPLELLLSLFQELFMPLMAVEWEEIC